MNKWYIIPGNIFLCQKGEIISMQDPLATLEKDIATSEYCFLMPYSGKCNFILKFGAVIFSFSFVNTAFFKLTYIYSVIYCLSPTQQRLSRLQ